MATVCAAACVNQSHADIVDWTSASSGSWSDSGNWDPGVPATSGDTVNFDYLGFTSGTTVVSTIDSSWSTDGSVLGMTFGSDSGGNANTYQFSTGAGVSNFTIGSGGLTSAKTKGGIDLYTGTLTLSDNQTWTNLGDYNNGKIRVASSFYGSGNLTKDGVGVLRFDGGTSSNWSGSFTLSGGGKVQFFNSDQYDRLGSSITWANDAYTVLRFDDAAGGTLSGDITFQNEGTSSYQFYTQNAQSLSLTGNLSSSSALNGSIVFQANKDTELQEWHLSGDNSGLTSARGNDQVKVYGGFMYLESANALGAGNSLNVLIGNEFTTAVMTTGLYTTDGNNFVGDIKVAANNNSSAAAGFTTLGLDGAGAATFSGDITLGSTSTTGAKAVDTVFLSASAGGKVTFSGTIFDQSVSSTDKVSNVVITGTGTVVVSGANTYVAATTIQAGSTLQVDNSSGSATGSGSVLIQNGGVLAGSGSITPGEGNDITAESGASVSPGDGIGTLTFNGASTSEALATMNAGATFAFDLGAANTSDQLSFWNYALGDLVLNDTAINFENAQEGTYTLFTFYEDSGSTVTASGISDGLVLGTGLDGFSGELQYNANTISLNLTAVPEPTTFALAIGGLCFLFVLRRRFAK